MSVRETIDKITPVFDDGQKASGALLGSSVKQSVSKVGVMRIMAAAAFSYLANGIVVMATEEVLSALGRMPGSTYLVIDLITQCLYTVGAGYLCCVIARPAGRAALLGLIGLGLSVGSISLVTSWKEEPHWYGVGLLAVYAPCAWFGWMWRVRRKSVAVPGNS